MKFGFQEQRFMKKPEKIYRVLYLVDVGQKQWFLAKINIF